MWLAANSAYLGVLQDFLVEQGSSGPPRLSLLFVEPREPIHHGMASLHDRPHGNAPSDSLRHVPSIASFLPHVASKNICHSHASSHGQQWVLPWFHNALSVLSDARIRTRDWGEGLS